MHNPKQHDFKAHVESQLARLAPDDGLVSELAQDLEQRYEALVQDGSADADAWRDANQQMDWPHLSVELSTTLPKPPRTPELSGNSGVLSHILPDLRYAFRQLKRNPGFAATAILILAVAIGANTAIFSAFDALVLHPLPYREPEQLVKVSENFKKFDITGMQLSALEFDDIRAMTRSFSHIAGIANGQFTLTGAGDAEGEWGLRVSASIFPMLGVQPILGSPFRVEDEEYGKDRVVVISEGLWRRRFGANPNIVGTSIEINRESYRVAAVTRPFLDYLGKPWDLWVPLSFQPSDRAPASRGGKFIDVVARMKPEITMAQTKQDIATVTSGMSSLYPRNYSPNVGFSLQATGLASTVAGDLRQPLLFLLAAVGVLMLIACANVSNLLMTRASVRRKEMSIRAALGAGRARVVSQLMTESLVIAAVSGILGIALAFALLKLFELYGPEDLIRVAGVGVNGWVVAFAIGVSSVASILFGLIPALTASAGLNDVLKQSARGVTAGRRLFRESMVALEVAASLVLLIGAGLLIRSFLQTQQADAGFNAKSVLVFDVLLPSSQYGDLAQRIAFYRTFQERLQTIPGVISAGAVDRVPFGGSQSGSPLQVVGRTEDPNTPRLMLRPARILPGYFESLQVPLLRGRYFNQADTPDTTPVAIIDQATALKFFPNGEDPIGKQITRVEPGLTATIVGVVGALKRDNLSAAPELGVYHSATQNIGTGITFTVRTALDPLAMISSVRHELDQIDPRLPLTRTVTMEQRLADSLAKRRLSTQLMMFFGLTALLLAATGLYAVLSYVVHQRRREVGIRIALGAEPRQVVKLVARQGLLPVVLGIVAGLGAALAAARLLNAQLYQMSPTDPLVYASVTGLLVLTALIAIAVPARRAAAVDPVIALRDE